MRDCEQTLGQCLGEASSAADLGGSSEYSSVILEGQRGEVLHVNSSWTWVNRS